MKQPFVFEHRGFRFHCVEKPVENNVCTKCAFEDGDCIANTATCYNVGCGQRSFILKVKRVELV